jgi:hypothetical protein
MTNRGEHSGASPTIAFRRGDGVEDSDDGEA